MEDQNSFGQIHPFWIEAQEQNSNQKQLLAHQQKHAQQKQGLNDKSTQKQTEQTTPLNAKEKKPSEIKQNQSQNSVQKLYKLKMNLNGYYNYKATTNRQQYAKDQLLTPSCKKYSRVVKLKVKGKMKKRNALLPYESFFNGYLTTFKNGNFYVFTCLHELLYGESIDEEIQIEKISFESLEYQGELYCLDETSSIYAVYKQRLQAFKLRKKKQYQEFLRKQQKSEKYLQLVYEVVQNDWIVLIPKKLQKQQIPAPKIQVKREGEMQQLQIRGYQYYLKLVSWQRQDYFGTYQKQQPREDLKIKYYTDKETPQFQYIQKPEVFLHGFCTKKINSGSPFFQQKSQKTRWVGMESGQFCQKGIGIHFSKDFQIKTVNPLVQKLLKECSKQEAPVSNNSSSFYSNTFSKHLEKRQQIYPFTNLVQISAKKNGQDYYKFSNGVLLNQCLVLVFLHNIYEELGLDYKLLNQIQFTFTGKQRFKLNLLNEEAIKNRIQNFQKFKGRWRRAIREPKTVQNIPQLQQSIFQHDLLFLRIEQNTKPVKQIDLKCYEQPSSSLYLQAFDHKLSQDYKKLNISSHIIELTQQQMKLSNNLYQTSQPISPYKSGGLIVKKQGSNFQVVGLNYDFLSQISMPILFNKEIIQKITLIINKRKDQIAKQSIKSLPKIQVQKKNNLEAQTFNTFRVLNLYCKSKEQSLEDKIIQKNLSQVFQITLKKDDLYYIILQQKIMPPSFQLSFKLLFNNQNDFDNLEYLIIYLSNKQSLAERIYLQKINFKIKQLARQVKGKPYSSFYKFEVKTRRQIEMKFSFARKTTKTIESIKYSTIIQTLSSFEFVDVGQKNLNINKVSIENILPEKALFNIEFKTKKPMQVALQLSG